MECEEIRELIEPYVLGVLDEDERARVKAHLRRCPDCRALVAEYEAAVHQLPEALGVAAPVELPAGLKGRLLARIESARSRRRARASVGRAVLVAGALMLVLSIAATAALSVALGRERGIRERLAGLVDRQETVLEVVDSPNTERAVLTPPTGGSRAYGKVFTNTELPFVVIMVGRLPAARDGEAYYVWLTERDRTRLAGVLNVNDQGFGLLVINAGRTGPRYDAARVVLQQERSSAPTSDPVLVWRREN